MNKQLIELRPKGLAKNIESSCILEDLSVSILLNSVSAGKVQNNEDLLTTLETTLCMKFANNSKEELECELIFPLPEGSTICGYSIDIQGKMVEGVIVQKELAKKAFESQVRRHYN
jgi:hypothetical protein